MAYASRDIKMSCGVYEGETTLVKGDFTVEYGGDPIVLFSRDEYVYQFNTSRVTNYDQSHSTSLVIINSKNNEVVAEAYAFSETDVPQVSLQIKGMPSAYCRPTK